MPPEGQNPDFDDLNLPLEESPLAEPEQWNPSEFEFPAEFESIMQPTAGEGADAGGPSGEAPLDDGRSGGPPPGDESPAEFTPEEEPRDEALAGAADGAVAGEGGEEGEVATKRGFAWLAYVEWSAAVLVAIALYLLASLLSSSATGFWNGIYLVLMAMIAFALWKTRRVWTSPEISAPFTLMIVVSLAALLTAVYCLGLELRSYDWDQKAKKAKQPAVVTSAAQFGPATTIAAAWPIDVQLTAKADASPQAIGSPWMT